MRPRNLVFASLVAGVVALPAASARALLVKVSVNFGPTITGPDNGTLVVTANPGDRLLITWALGDDADAMGRDLSRYSGFVSGVPGVSGVDIAEISRDGASALELTGQGFDPIGNPNAPDPGEFGYFVSSDGAPTGQTMNGGELWRIEYMVTNPVTDAAADISFTIPPSGCIGGFTNNGRCPGTSDTDYVTASLRVDAVPDPGTLLLLGLGLAASLRASRSVAG